MVAMPAVNTSWGFQFDLAADKLLVEDILKLDLGEEEYDASDLLISEDDYDDSSPHSDCSARRCRSLLLPAPTSLTRVNARLSDWASCGQSSFVAGPAGLLYKGNKLPLASSGAKQLLPVFLETSSSSIWHCGLGPWQLSLSAVELPQQVVSTIQNA